MLLMHLKLPTSLVYALPIFCNSKFVTVFRKTNRSASIIAYARKYAFEQEDANVNKTRRRNVGLASNLDGGIFPVKGNKAIKFFFFSR